MNDQSLHRFVLGVDGGGTKTAAKIAAIHEDGTIHELGTGYSGPANVQAVGTNQALANLNSAVNKALAACQMPILSIDCALLALAGSSIASARRDVERWASDRKLATTTQVIHDADPVLAAGTPDGWGVALIVGTGSVALGLDPNGHKVVVGGWGHWIGDKGSGFDLGREALMAVAEAADGVGQKTELAPMMLDHLNIADPREILAVLNRAKDARQEIAGLAPILFAAAAEKDEVASHILNDGALATAKLARVTAKQLSYSGELPIALAGGVVKASHVYRDLVVEHLQASGIELTVPTVVAEPVSGSLIMARDFLSSLKPSSAGAT